MEQGVIIRNNNLLFHFSGHNNELLVLKQWKGALNSCAARSVIILRRPRSEGIILDVCQGNRYEHRINLHSTSTVQFLVSFPMIFVAIHRYTPLSFRLMFDKISSLLLEITSTVLSMIHSILGTGLPVALHPSVALSPSITGVEH